MASVGVSTLGGRNGAISKNISPPEPSRLNDPKHWRDKAAEARAKADGMTDPQAKATMERVAKDHERLAVHADNAEGTSARGALRRDQAANYGRSRTSGSGDGTTWLRPRWALWIV